MNHYNARGDVVATSDGSGNQTWRGQYDGFGEVDWEVGTRRTRQLSNTKDQDVAGLVNEGFRYRDLETGSFLTRDPLGFVGEPNVYTYVVQNPWTRFDPLGLKKNDVVNVDGRKQEVNNKHWDPQMMMLMQDWCLTMLQLILLDHNPSGIKIIAKGCRCIAINTERE